MVVFHNAAQSDACGAPCVKLRNTKFCIIFLVTVILVKLHAISYIVAICVKLLQFMYIAKKHFNRLLIAMVIC